MANLGNRIVVLIDMDCFFCQVETRLKPEHAGKPLAVVQYNQWKLGGIIAVNYEARDFGVTRHMRGEEAKEKCPDIVLAIVPSQRGKADTSRYRSAGREVIDVLKKYCNIVERASVDEAYLDITQIVDDKLSKEIIDSDSISKQLENSYIVGFSESDINNEEQRSKGLQDWLSELADDIQIQRLAIAGAFVEHIRKEVYDTTGFRCSAGISFNKILAKLACGLHKPNRQTILPASAVPELYGSLPVKKVRNLGGKLGDMVIDSLKCNVMADLLPYSLQYLQNRFDEKTGMWLYNIARGIDSEPVTPRLVSKSIGACKRFPGKQAIVELDVLKHWIGELSAEVCERLEQDLEENERKASQLIVSFQYCQDKKLVSQSRTVALTSYKQEKVAEQSLNIVVKATQQLLISFLGLSAGKFIKAKGSENFMNFFKSGTSDKVSTVTNSNVENNIVKIDEVNDDVQMSEAMDGNRIVEQVEVFKANLKPSTSSKVSRRSSPCSKIQKTLKTDNFKKSFFMNILKDKQPKNENLEPEIKLDNHSDEIDCDNEIESHENSNPEELGNNTDETENVASSSKIMSHPQSHSTITNTASVGLQEIFPDLNDIDPNIVRLLPPHLQEEARKFLKKNESRNKTSDTNKLKNNETNKSTKNKVSKIKSTNEKPRIQNFFIKTDVNSDSTFNNFKKCTQCGQSILVEKFDEHNDYHVAQNLQKEMNRMTNNNDVRSRKNVLESPNHLKRHSDEIVSKIPKKPILSFFQQ
ncbi:DNA-directed DNA polymerase eta [Nasonia vitripennis]|uniref:DNA polymerase eta n=1 Tax=Nasonia vitripennis TaxID=7425 RepID=A0A7M6W8A4_NASVI|nr:DNA-directed DNA polymerase eta [Nasonia vitripennis]